MPFPLSWRSSFRVPAPTAASVAVDEILGAIGSALERARASRVRLVGERITYRVAWFRPTASRWNVLAQFDRGVVCVRRVSDGFEVEYEVSLRRLLGTDLLLVAAMFAVLMVGYGREPLGDLIPLFLFVWLAFYGAGAFISLVRYSEFLRSAAAARIGAAEPNQSPSSEARSA